VQTLGDVLNQPLGVLVEHGVVLDDDQGVVSLFKNGHELKDRECSADNPKSPVVRRSVYRYYELFLQ